MNRVYRINVDEVERKMLHSILKSEGEVECINMTNLEDAYVYLRTIREVVLDRNYITRFTIDTDMVKETHEFILPEYHGKFANSVRCARMSETEIIEYCKPDQIEILLNQLIKRQHYYNPIEFTALLLWIHPFPDGNGRLAKLLYYYLTGDLIEWNQDKFLSDMIKVQAEIVEEFTSNTFERKF